MDPSCLTLRVLSWNVHKCMGSDRKRDPARIMSIIAEHAPDVAILQEADLRFGRTRAILDPEHTLRHAGLSICSPGGMAARGWRGNLILAKPEIACVETTRLALPSLEPRGALICRLRSDEVVFDVIGMHLALAGPWRRLQSEAISAHIQTRSMVPTVVAGDTNDWRKRSRALEALEATLGSRSTRVKSFPASRPILSLDRIMAGRGAVMGSLEAMDARTASDHAPVLSTVRMA